jgi:hypothetical protein
MKKRHFFRFEKVHTEKSSSDNEKSYFKNGDLDIQYDKWRRKIDLCQTQIGKLLVDEGEKIKTVIEVTPVLCIKRE